MGAEGAALDRARARPQKMVQRLLWAVGEGHRRDRRGVVAEVPAEAEVAEVADNTTPAAIAVAVGVGAGRLSPVHTRLGLSVAIRGARVHLSLVVKWIGRRLPSSWTGCAPWSTAVPEASSSTSVALSSSTTRG